MMWETLRRPKEMRSCSRTAVLDTRLTGLSCTAMWVTMCPLPSNCTGSAQFWTEKQPFLWALGGYPILFCTGKTFIKWGKRGRNGHKKGRQTRKIWKTECLRASHVSNEDNLHYFNAEVMKMLRVAISPGPGPFQAQSFPVHQRLALPCHACDTDH